MDPYPVARNIHKDDSKRGVVRQFLEDTSESSPSFSLAFPRPLLSETARSYRSVSSRGSEMPSKASEIPFRGATWYRVSRLAELPPNATLHPRGLALCSFGDQSAEGNSESPRSSHPANCSGTSLLG